MIDTRRFLFRMTVFLVAVLAVVAGLAIGLLHAFMANPLLNCLILAVLGVGIFLNYRQVLMLKPDIAWVAEYRRGISPLSTAAAPRMLAPIAAALGERQRTEKHSLSAPAMRALLDGIASRLDEGRDTSRYFIGLMVFLGLLGTFWGLSQTVGSIGDVIGSLNIGNDTVGNAFESLKSGLGAPLAGMGTAFSSSLLGLGGSLILGFLDLQAGQAQNAFFNELEEWLAGQMKVSAGRGGIQIDTGEPVPAYIQALLEQTADSLDNLSRIIARGEESRAATNQSLRTLTDKLSSMTDFMKTEQNLMVRLAENQLEIKPLLAKMTDGTTGGLDTASRNHIRSIDSTLNRLAEEMHAGRDELIRELRSEVKLLARTIAAAAEEVTERS